MALNPVVVAQAAGVFKDASDLAHSTNPILVAVNATATFIYICAPPRL